MCYTAFLAPKDGVLGLSKERNSKSLWIASQHKNKKASGRALFSILLYRMFFILTIVVPGRTLSLIVSGGDLL